MEKQKNTFVICAIVKNEHRFIKEWADYHLSIGFNHIYIYEDYESDSHKDIFKGYKNISVIPLKNTPIKNYHTPKTQRSLYDWFLTKCKKSKECDWIAFIDIDEFIMFDDNYNLEKLCEEFNQYPGIYLSWKNYTANGHVKRPEGGVLENYTQPFDGVHNIDDGNQWQHKSLCNVHVAEGLDTIHSVKNGIRPNGDIGKNTPQCFVKAWINHYYCKSFEDYCVRIFERGNMQNNFRSFDQFFQLNPDFKDREKELLASVRYRHTYNTMYISKKHRIISGGNECIINKLKYENNIQ